MCISPDVWYNEHVDHCSCPFYVGIGVLQTARLDVSLLRGRAVGIDTLLQTKKLLIETRSLLVRCA